MGGGLRYYFVQPRARLAPFLEVRGAAGFTDSRGYHYAQQQDFTFSYMLGAGFRYDFNRRLSVTAERDRSTSLKRLYDASQLWLRQPLGSALGTADSILNEAPFPATHR